MTSSQRRLPSQLAFLASVLLLVVTAQDAPPDELYLLPILRCGPSNQKRDLRAALALGHELGRKVILTGITKHYMDKHHEMQQRKAHPNVANTVMCFKDIKHGYMPMQSVIDTEYLAHQYGAVTISDVRARGWDGKLDGLVYSKDHLKEHNKDLVKTIAVTNINIEGAQPVPVNVPLLNCNATIVQDIRQRTKKFKYLGMLTVMLTRTTVPNLVAEEDVEVDQLQGCPRSLAEANRALRPSAWLRDIADKYIAKYLGDKPFMCMQVRPYPDTCLEAWKNGTVISGQPAGEVCNKNHQDLHDRVGKCAALQADKVNLTNGPLFVMTHPKIRHQVHKRLEQAGFSDIAFIVVHHVEELAGCVDHSATFMVMIEEAICAQAVSFIGSHASSVSQSIGFVRLGMGMKQNKYLESMTDC